LVGERPRIELEPPATAATIRKAPVRLRPRPTVPSHSDPKTPMTQRLLNSLGPLGFSLLAHCFILLLLSLVTWAHGVGGSGFLPGEFTAQLVQQDQSIPQGGFRFEGDAGVDRPDANESSDRIRDLASLLADEGAVQMAAVDLGNAGLRDVPVDTLQRSDVVGTQLFGGADGKSGEGGGGFGEGASAGGGPVGSLWGVGAGQRADSVVYVMDRSGSMMDNFEILQLELKKAIGELSEDQRFNVLWFNEGRKPDMWAPELRKATIENKKSAFAKIDEVVPSGLTDPIPAIHYALSFKPTPDVMFLLSDGDFNQQNEDVLKSIRQKNRNKRTIINTILFSDEKIGVIGENVLETIARENRGVYKQVLESDVRTLR